MQALTWNKEELHASVQRKLAVLRANRGADKGLNLDQRLALAEDRIAFDDARLTAHARRSTDLPPTANPKGQTMRADNKSLAAQKFSGLFFGRADDADLTGQSGQSGQSGHLGGDGGDDGDGSSSHARHRAADLPRLDLAADTTPRIVAQPTPLTDSFAATSHPGVSVQGEAGKTRKVRPDLSNAVDSHAACHQQSQPHLHAQQRRAAAADTECEPHAADYPPNEVPADKVQFRPESLYGLEGQDQVADEDLKHRRLIEQTKRQSSNQWVVLDRATVLDCLSRNSGGMTMVEVAARLLGAQASPRDTRRLSALMKREEQRKTVTGAGRGKPIMITAAGRAAIAIADVKQLNRVAVERRQKRILAQQQRLVSESEKLLYESKKEAEKAQKKGEKRDLMPKKCSSKKTTPVSGVLVKNGQVLIDARGDSNSKPVASQNALKGKSISTPIKSKKPAKTAATSKAGQSLKGPVSRASSTVEVF